MESEFATVATCTIEWRGDLEWLKVRKVESEEVMQPVPRLGFSRGIFSPSPLPLRDVLTTREQAEKHVQRV